MKASTKDKWISVFKNGSADRFRSEIMKNMSPVTNNINDIKNI